MVFLCTSLFFVKCLLIAASAFFSVFRFVKYSHIGGDKAHQITGEVMLPILFLPITVPVLIAAVEATAYALGAGEDASFWFRLLVVYDVVFVTVSFLTFEHVVQE